MKNKPRFLNKPIVSIFKMILDEFTGWLNFFFRVLPVTPISNKLRNYYWHFCFKGKYNIYHVGRMTNFFNLDKIEIGYQLSIGENCIVDASDSDAGIYFGNNVLIASGLFIRVVNHRFDRKDIPIRLQGYKGKTLKYKEKQYNVVIEDDVWIASNVTILSGVKIGKGSIIGSGSLLIKEVPPYSIVGAPTAVILASRDII